MEIFDSRHSDIVKYQGQFYKRVKREEFGALAPVLDWKEKKDKIDENENGFQLNFTRQFTVMKDAKLARELEIAFLEKQLTCLEMKLKKIKAKAI